MTDIGGPDWIEVQARRLATVDVDPALEIVIEQTITGDRSTTWHVVVSGGSARPVLGHHPSPDVTLTAGPATAAAIAGGRTSAQREFLDGRLRIGGDITALINAREAIAALL